jgi:Transglutaminase-like superfamily
MPAVDVDFYRAPGPLTRLRAEQAAMVRALGREPETLCRVVQGLVVLPPHATAAGLSDDRLRERNTRSAADLLSRLIELGGALTNELRPVSRRIVGTCRHFAVLSCAFLRVHEIPARARCGFATYFQPGLAVDHWITEYWSAAERRWVRIDSEILGLDAHFAVRPNDLAPGAFLSGGEAWALCRHEAADPMTFGVHGTDHAWGPAEIIGNAIRDLAGMNKVEMLPWDEWGPMGECYRGEIRPAVEAVVDAISDACAADDRQRMADLYDAVAVPEHMVA